MLFSNVPELQSFLERSCSCSGVNAKPFTTLIPVHPRTAQIGSWKKVDFRQRVWSELEKQFHAQLQSAQNLDPLWCMSLVFGAPEHARETDLDNYAKSTLDAIKNRLLGDDSKIQHLELVKAWVKRDRPTVYGDPFFIGVRLARGQRNLVTWRPAPPAGYQNRHLTDKLLRLQRVLDLAATMQLKLGKVLDWDVTDTRASADEISWIRIATAKENTVFVYTHPTHEHLLQFKVNRGKKVLDALPEAVANIIVSS